MSCHHWGGWAESWSPQAGTEVENSSPNLMRPITRPTIRPQKAPGSLVLYTQVNKIKFELRLNLGQNIAKR